MPFFVDFLTFGGSINGACATFTALNLIEEVGRFFPYELYFSPLLMSLSKLLEILMIFGLFIR